MNLTLLATEGFGLNFNLFETNILNWAVVVFGLYKFLPGFLGKMLKKRREGILLELKDAEDRLLNACLLYTSPSPRDVKRSRMPSSA